MSVSDPRQFDMHTCSNSLRSTVASATFVAVARKNEELHVLALRMRVCPCLIACCKGQATALNNVREY